MKKTKRSLLMSVVSLLLCFSMLLGSTFAWFTDSVTSGSNVIQSGNLDLEVQYTLDGENWKNLDGANDLFQKGLWEPGHTEVVALRIENKGSLALKYKANMNIIKETIGKNKEGGDIVLSEILTVSTLTQQANQIGDIAVMLAFKGENAIDYSAPVAFKSGNVLQNDSNLLPGEAHYVIVKVDMAETVGNEANHDGVNKPSIEFGINVLATQTSNESDSFGSDYDGGITFDDLADTNVLASETKTLVAGETSLVFVLNANNMTIANVTVPADAIEDPTKPVTVTFDGIDPSATAIVDENTQAFSYDIKVTNLKSGLTEDQMVTVVVTAPHALAAMKAYHNGVLIEDAVYDEVAGTITFKTASFSPYDFTAQVVPVDSLAGLREAVKHSNVEINLTADLEIDLTKGSAMRSEDHVLVSGNKTYYNAVNIIGENVAIDLNGHKITVFCGDAYNSNSDVGALFFVDNSGSLNIVDRAGNGFIKMRSSIYMVWAPYANPSYVDIYSGAFIADSYAGDPIGTSTDPDSEEGTMQNENSNRALIYAGTGGNMNIRGGYFLYNNTPNDVLNRNNGAFNCTNGYEGTDPFITIHDGVMLIDKDYRQDPTHTNEFKNILKKYPDAKPTDPGIMDNSSILLGDGCEIAETTLLVPIKIDGKEYSTWYKVISGITSITAKPVKANYNIGHTFTTDDFIVYAIGEAGSGNIENFAISNVDTSTAGEKTVTITYTNAAGKQSTATCVVTIVNLSVLNINYDAYDGNYHRMWWFGAGNVDVSGWFGYPELGYAGEESQLTMTGGNGEKISGFEKDWHLIQRQHSDAPQGLEFYSNNNWYGLTIENAVPYTTLGINCVIGYDAPVLGFGYYINGDVSTLKYNAPAVMHPTSDEAAAGYKYTEYGPNGAAHALTQFTCYDFEPGKSYTVTWVVLFEDGIQKLTDWTVNMKAASESDKVFVDTEKLNANVIIMAGQSNMFGPAPLTEEVIAKYANVDFTNVHIKYSNINFNVNPDGTVASTMSTVFSNDEFEPYKLGMGAQGNSYFGPELALAYHLATTEGLKDQQWYIVKYAPAGTALGGQWTNTCVLDGKTTTLTDSMLDYVQTALDELSANGFDVHVRNFMWMQGESDAGAEVYAKNYAELEENLVERVRTEFAAYATRPIGSVAGSGITFINAGIANNDAGKNTANGGPNDWVYSSTVNAGKISNSQYITSILGVNAYEKDGSSLAIGPCAGLTFGKDGIATPSIVNPDLSGAIVNSLYIDTSHLLSKAQAHALDPSDPLYEDYAADSDDVDWAHYSADSMLKLGELYGSCLQFMMTQYN